LGNYAQAKDVPTTVIKDEPYISEAYLITLAYYKSSWGSLNWQPLKALGQR